MTVNEGNIDRFLRIAVGAALLGVTLAGKSAWFAAIGIVLMATGVVGICPIYRALGVRTSH